MLHFPQIHQKVVCKEEMGVSSSWRDWGESRDLLGVAGKHKDSAQAPLKITITTEEDQSNALWGRDNEKVWW